MTNQHKAVGLINHYDGLLSRPFLAEHWYKGFVTAALIFFLLWLLLNSLFDGPLWLAAIPAGLSSLLLLAAVVTQHQRFEIDNIGKCYRSYLWVLGIRFGKWLPLPIIDSVKIRRRIQEHFLPLEEDAGLSIGITATEDKWQVLLHIAGSSTGILAAYVVQVQAEATAAELAALLGVAVDK